MGLSEIEHLARRYRRHHHFNLLPIGANKKPTLPTWGEWALRKQEGADLAAMGWKGAAGVAAIGGAVSGDLVCLDFDDVSRKELLSEALAALGLPPDYRWAVLTPGNGCHVWVVAPDAHEVLGEKGKAVANLEGCSQVELRGQGHYTILPGSRHPDGGRYRFAFGEPDEVPTESPATVSAQALRQLADWGRPRLEAVPTSGPAQGSTHPYVAAAIEGEVGKLAATRKPGRNDQLNKSAMALGSLGMSLEEVTGILLPVAIKTGLPELESRRTIESGWSAGQRNPREIPQDDRGPDINWQRTKPEAKRARRAVVRTLSTVQPEQIEWLWPGRLARGKLTILAGDPGLGKSFMTLDMAARISTGGSWPSGEPAPKGDVLLLTAEDGIADTVVPRLLQMGADMEHVHHLESVLDPRDDHERLFRLQTDLEALEEAVGEFHPLLVIIDPLSAYLGGIDSHKSAEVRGALAPLMTLGDRTGVALLCNAHLSKAESRSALYRVSGSLDFVAAARAAFLVAQDPEDDERRVVLTMKMNIAEKPPGIAFSITNGAVAWDDRPVTLDLTEVLNVNRESHSKTEAASLLLEEMLAGGPVAESEISDRARAEDISQRTLRRAKAALGVSSQKMGILDGWYWSLPTKGPSEGGQTPPHHYLAAYEEGQVGNVGRRSSEGGGEAEGGQIPTHDKKVIFEEGHVGNVGREPFVGGVEVGHLREALPSCAYESHRRFWRRGEGEWRCALCRPTSVPEIAEWLDLDELDAQESLEARPSGTG